MPCIRRSFAIVLIWAVVLFAPLVCIIDCHLRLHAAPTLASIFICDLRGQAGRMPANAPHATALPTIIYDVMIPIGGWVTLLCCLLRLLHWLPAGRSQDADAPLTPPPRSGLLSCSHPAISRSFVRSGSY
ncbi:MAG: hypothetical protein Fur005_40880 [Roseiflexaceae bacterium]